MAPHVINQDTVHLSELEMIDHYKVLEIKEVWLQSSRTWISRTASPIWPAFLSFAICSAFAASSRFPVRQSSSYHYESLQCILRVMSTAHV